MHLPKRQGGPHAHCGFFDESGKHVLVCDLGLDKVLIYKLDRDTGKLTEAGAVKMPAGSGPRHVVARNGLVYLLNELGNTLVVLAPRGDGTMDEAQVAATLPAGFEGFSHTAHLEVSPDGRHLYASNRGHDSILVADLDADGLVARREWVPSGGEWPWFFLLADDRMLVANNLSDVITVFDVDSAGDLRPAGEIACRRPIFFAPGV